MRQVLIEAARRRKADKRGGGLVVTFDESIADHRGSERPARPRRGARGAGASQPRQAMLVESRFFGGLDVAEAASCSGVSEATVLRDWRAAQAWLARELRGTRQSGR